MPIGNAFDRVAIGAGIFLKDVAAHGHGRVVDRGRDLRLQPRVKLLGLAGHHAQQHSSMLVAAIFRALTQVQALAIGIEPCVIGVVWNHIHFARKGWHPPRMNHVGAFKAKPHRPIDGHMQLVGNNNFAARNIGVQVAIFPPPLMTNHNYFKRARRRFGEFNGTNSSHRCERKHKNNQQRNNGPRNFNWIASVHLAWFIF